MPPAHKHAQAHEKVTDAITKIDGEQCYNVSLTKPLSASEAETLAWCVRAEDSQDRGWEGRRGD